MIKGAETRVAPVVINLRHQGTSERYGSLRAFDCAAPWSRLPDQAAVVGSFSLKNEVSFAIAGSTYFGLSYKST